jgi:Arc/MetJ family transcription regulator
MLTHMRTTIEINDDLMTRAKECARRERTTLRAVIEDALRAALSERRKPKKKFRLKDGSFKGDGFAPGVDPTNWEQIRDIIYEGRGS